MADMHLTQAEADALLAMAKHRSDEERYDFPMGGQSLSIPLRSHDHREHFLLDLHRTRINLAKVKFQSRARQVVVLARLDLGGAPHRNPDDTEVPAPHLHLYREGYGHRWAYPVPAERFRDVADLWRTLEDFMAYCNIVEPPIIERGLFT
jgi:hypothetical protein